MVRGQKKNTFRILCLQKPRRKKELQWKATYLFGGGRCIV